MKSISDKRIIAIESTSICNITCDHCPNGKVKVDDGFMEIDTLKECLQYAHGYTELNWRGEPLVHPSIAELVRIAKITDETLNLGFHTNALKMTRELFRTLIDNGLNWLHVSLHTPRSCRQFKEILSWNEDAGKPVYVYADTDNTEEQLLALSMGLAPGTFSQAQIANWGGWTTKFRTIHQDPMAAAKNCAYINQNNFVAAWNGMVNACCWDFEMKHQLGHVRDFDRIEHRPPYPLCSSCTWVRHYEKLPE